MEKTRLLYLITGTETPRFVSEREMCIVDICLKLICDREEEISSLEELINLKSQTISVLEETVEGLKQIQVINEDKIESLQDSVNRLAEFISDLNN